MLKRPFITALSINCPMLAVWYLLEAAQFGTLQHGRICDDVVFLAYFAITWALLRLMSKKQYAHGHGTEGSTCYVAVIRGTRGMPPRYLAEGGAVTDDVNMAEAHGTAEAAAEAARAYPSAEPMAATLTVTLSPLR